jgi:cytidylate kinase
MPVIVVSSDSYATGREIAESTARVLGYDLLGREVLSRVADKYNVSEVRLVQALDESPSFLRRSSKLRNRHLAYIQEVVFSELLKDNWVCHGLAAHLYVLGVSHVLRVRILADAAQEVKRLAVEQGISISRAMKRFDRRKTAQRRWSVATFQLDETDPSHYDLVISLSQIDLNEAVNIIRETAGYPRFKPMTYSVNCLEDLALSAGVRAGLWERFPDAVVRADRGTVVVETTALRREKEKNARAIKETAGKVAGVEYVEVHIKNHLFRSTPRSFRQA